jgi:hypothetical protein
LTFFILRNLLIFKPERSTGYARSEPIPTNKHFDLWMDVSMESGRREQVVFTAKSVWGREDDDNDDSYNTGFQFLNLTPEALQSMQSIIDELGA